MSIENNKAIVRRFHQEIDHGNLDAMHELVAENYLNHAPSPFPGLRPAERASSSPSRSSGRRPRDAT